MGIFPLLYHAHYSLHQEDLPFWAELAAQGDGPLLELGCGSGRVLLHLAGKGRRAVGLDRSWEMLRFLKEHALPSLPEVRRAQVMVLQGDMTRFHLGLDFKLILLPCNTFSTLPAAGRAATLACISSQLRRGGKFAVALPNPIQLRRLPRVSEPEVEDIFAHPLDGEPVQVSSAWERTSQYFLLSWIYDHLLPDGRVERHTAQVRHTLASPEIYLVEMEQVGLQVLDRLGDFDGSPYEPDSPNLIFVAKKR